MSYLYYKIVNRIMQDSINQFSAIRSDYILVYMYILDPSILYVLYSLSTTWILLLK